MEAEHTWNSATNETRNKAQTREIRFGRSNTVSDNVPMTSRYVMCVRIFVHCFIPRIKYMLVIRMLLVLIFLIVINA